MSQRLRPVQASCPIGGATKLGSFHETERGAETDYFHKMFFFFQVSFVNCKISEKSFKIVCSRCTFVDSISDSEPPAEASELVRLPEGMFWRTV